MVWRLSRHISRSTAGLAPVVARSQIACVRRESYVICLSLVASVLAAAARIAASELGSAGSFAALSSPPVSEDGSGKMAELRP